MTQPKVRTAALEGLTAPQAVLRGAALSWRVPGSDVDALCPRVQSIRASLREAAQQQGDVGGHAVLVSSQVKLARASGGRARRVDLLGPAGQSGELSVLDPGPRSATGSAPEVMDDAVRLTAQAAVASLPYLERAIWNLVKAATGLEHLAHGVHLALRVARLKPAIQFRAVARRHACPAR